MSGDALRIIHLGGERGVTGSCHLLQARGLNILVDCGSTQGEDPAVSMENWPVRPDQIDYLFLTHAHIDHSGRVPELVQRGFAGEIITTRPTKALLGPMLADAMGLTGMGTEQITTTWQTIDRLAWGFEYGQTFDLEKGIKFKLGRAGHILGSCFVRFEMEPAGWSVIFSGDLGSVDTPILPDPDPPDCCDLLILESTYGDRLHEGRRERIERLGRLLGRAVSDGGKVFIPAFALGRTQELIYEMDRLVSDSGLQQQFPELSSREALPVILDTPLGLEVTKIYSRLSEYWDREARQLLQGGDHPLDFADLYAVGSYREHLELLHMAAPAVIIAGSGMCTGGRIVNHLKHGLPDPRNDLFFVGYQARGTPGAEITRCSGREGGYVCLDGERIDIKAKVHILSGYSAHADQKGLVDWVGSMPRKPAKIKLVHGEQKAREALKQKLQELGYHAS